MFLKGYLTDSGNVNLQRVQRIMLELGKVEDEIFKKRQENEVAFKAREKAKRRRSDGYGQYRPNFSLLQNTQFAPKVILLYYSLIQYFGFYFLLPYIILCPCLIPYSFISLFNIYSIFC